MEEQLEQSKQRLHFCMAVIGGWFGAYMVLRFGHFASAATVNLLEMLTGAAQENWLLALLRLGGILVYIAAIFLTAWLPRRTHSDLRRWAILIDMAAAAILSLIPADREYAVYFSLFAMAFQWATFASKHGYPCSTIFSTNNLRQFVDAWVQVHLNRDADHTPPDAPLRRNAPVLPRRGCRRLYPVVAGPWTLDDSGRSDPGGPCPALAAAGCPHPAGDGGKAGIRTRNCLRPKKPGHLCLFPKIHLFFRQNSEIVMRCNLC